MLFVERLHVSFGNECYFLSYLNYITPKIYLSYLYNRPNNILHIYFKAVVFKFEYASESWSIFLKILIVSILELVGPG